MIVITEIHLRLPTKKWREKMSVICENQLLIKKKKQYRIKWIVHTRIKIHTGVSPKTINIVHTWSFDLVLGNKKYPDFPNTQLI